jgi:hypothetical protein
MAYGSLVMFLFRMLMLNEILALFSTDASVIPVAVNGDPHATVLAVSSILGKMISEDMLASED